MGGDVDTNGLAIGQTTPEERARIARKAAVHVAGRIAAEHPHPLDDVMPKLAGRTLAKDPAVRDDLLELLDAIGYRKETP
ncbi:hypothetical protein OG864_45015 [Streptomyces sp. NBC_00124]|uniref:hypothetical protein n=1 Tax=Streptomyces sp. NBC_00124 TaxID=2975662 RepID=UPI00225176D6|nr:hypothetical protein [Streptomyces sp. NBC_00124]MCX5365863.1 hypothetical protein [Streptomyces sp. NBC_00124]